MDNEIDGYNGIKTGYIISFDTHMDEMFITINAFIFKILNFENLHPRYVESLFVLGYNPSVGPGEPLARVEINIR